MSDRTVSAPSLRPAAMPSTMSAYRLSEPVVLIACGVRQLAENEAIGGGLPRRRAQPAPRRPTAPASLSETGRRACRQSPQSASGALMTKQVGRAGGDKRQCSPVRHRRQRADRHPPYSVRVRRQRSSNAVRLWAWARLNVAPAKKDHATRISGSAAMRMSRRSILPATAAHGIRAHSRNTIGTSGSRSSNPPLTVSAT